MMRSFTHHLSAPLLLLLGLVGVPEKASAESYTVNIDDISRVKVMLVSSETYLPEEAEGFVTGSNTVELDGTATAIQFSATEGNVITRVHYVAPGVGIEEPGADAFPRGGVYTVYAGTPEWDGCVIGVTSQVDAIMTATVTVDDPALISFQNSLRNPISLGTGDNTVTFSTTDNPFYISVLNDNTPLGVSLNGEWIQEKDAKYVIVNLSDNDQVAIYTDGTGTGGDTDDSKLWPDPNTLITELPVSKYPMTYTRSSYSFTPAFSQQVSGAARQIVFDTSGNGEVYIQNPFTFLTTDAYLKGINNQGTIEIRLPQLIYEEGDVKYWAYRLDATADGYAINPDVTQIIYVRGEGDGTWNFVGNDVDDYILGFCTADGNWSGYGEKDFIYAPVTDEIANAPRGCSYDTYTLYPENQDVLIAVSTSNDVYVRGLFAGCPDAAIKGSLENGTVTFPTRQYLGVFDGWHVYFYATDNDGELCDALEMTYSVGNDTYTSSPLSGYIITPGDLVSQVYTGTTNPSFSKGVVGVASIEAANSDVEYFDVMGRKVAAPVKGNIYIQIVKANDGTISNRKIIF